MKHPSESRESIWYLTLPPLVWATHFLACYLTSAIWFAKFASPGESPNTVRWAIGVYTLIALPIIAWLGWIGHQRDRVRTTASGPRDQDSHEDRHSFMGFAMLLLAALSAVATIFVGLVAVFVGGR